MTGRRSWWRWGLGLLIFAVALVALAKPAARFFVEREARRAGIDLRRYDLELGWGAVVLREVSFRLVGAESVLGRAEELRVELAGLAAERAQARGLTVTFTGPTGAALAELHTFSTSYPKALALPFQADRADLSFRDHAGDPAWLAAAGPLESGGGKGSLRADRTLVLGRELGPVKIGWTREEASLRIEIGGAEGSPPPVRALVTPREGSVGVELEWDPLPVASAPVPEALLAPLKAAKAKGRASIALPIAAEPAPMRGTAAIDLTGFVPPHPKDLDGIVFGDRSSVSMNFEVDPKREKVRFSDVKLTAGALALHGDGAGERIVAAGGAPDEATMDLDLAGTIACTELSTSVATARLGKLAGRIAGDLARRAVEGSVAVRILVHADSRVTPVLRIDPAIRVGCRLRGF